MKDWIAERWEILAKRLEAENLALQLFEALTAELRACRTSKKTHCVVARYAQLLLPETSGALFTRDNETLECVKTWGQPQIGKRCFPFRECTALEEMKPRHVLSAHGLVCPHLGDMAETYACFPLMWAGQALGVLHLQSAKKGRCRPRRQLVAEGDFTFPSQALLGSKMEQQFNTLWAEKIAGHCARTLGELHDHQVLMEQAKCDPLTGLYNRRRMEELLRWELRTRVRRSLGVIMLDIDHFKRFNTKFTHAGGDALLREFGVFLPRHVRRGDIACRFGGEEFVVILPGASLEDARRRAEEIRSAAKALQVDHHDRPLGRITVSIGVAATKEKDCSPEDLLERAAHALRRAKTNGRNKVEKHAAR